MTPTPLSSSTFTPHRVSFAAGFGRFGTRPALLAEDGTSLTYAELERRVVAVANRLGSRRLWVVEMAPDPASVVAYLAALRAGHPALLVAPGQSPQWTQAYPGAGVMTADGGWRPERPEGETPELHPELALLMTTSGTTGSPKLVRLSAENLTSNAEAIAGFLNLKSDDRSITTLPLHYSYGLSVLNSHLAVGASVVLAELSVVDPCFARLWERTRPTTLAGVPHTFELMERSGFDTSALPGLRRITQAGGRLRPELVSKYAALGRAQGWDLFVMYGQTEATARMAFLPPELAGRHPDSVGRAIAGGSLDIDDSGELIYRGPNVMLGYARGPQELALGRTVEELHTGDLGEVDDDGLIRIVGRRSRFVKPLGLRVDLGEVERWLSDQGIEGWCSGDDGLIVVAATAPPSDLEDALAEWAGLPRQIIRVVDASVAPRLASGKPDLAGLLAMVRREPDRGTSPHELSTVRGLFADRLGREVGPHDTFVGCGGDSLTYVEMSVVLEEIVGALPRDWHVMPVGELERRSSRARGAGRSLEFGVIARAMAITVIVGTHAGLWSLAGGAHVLLAVAGLNFARFQRRGDSKRASLARILVPSFLWIGVVATLAGRIDWPQALMVKSFVIQRGERWEYWFIEALVYLLLASGLLLTIRPVRRIESRSPRGFVFGLLILTVAHRFDAFGLAADHHRLGRAQEVAWLFVFGWAAAVASGRLDRLILTAVAVAAVPGFFGDPQRDALVLLGLLMVVWVPSMRVPRMTVGPISQVAGASLFIYLVHWQLYPPLGRQFGPGIAIAGSLIAGVLAWRLWLLTERTIRRPRPTLKPRARASSG